MEKDSELGGGSGKCIIQLLNHIFRIERRREREDQELLQKQGDVAVYV